MLVLTRKVTEEIKIGNEIVVKLLGIKGHCVRLGIEAPRSVRVMRSELVDGDAKGTAPTNATAITSLATNAVNAEENAEATVLVILEEGDAAEEGCSSASSSRLLCATRPCPATRSTAGRSTLAALVRRQSRRNKALLPTS